jgi:serine/threonine protein kinase
MRHGLRRREASGPSVAEEDEVAPAAEAEAEWAEEEAAAAAAAAEEEEEEGAGTDGDGEGAEEGAAVAEDGPRSASDSDAKSGDSESELTEPEKTFEWKRGDLIGKGQFGKVYMGMKKETGELIAVKVVDISDSADAAEQARSIESEMALLRRLRHRHIVNLLGTERQGNKLNILMEYVPGKSLDTMLVRFGALTERVCQSYTRQLLEALAFCHRHHVVHRDIKGKNILVDIHGHVKLCDFGSAKAFDSSLDNVTQTYNYTPLWTAPEVLTGTYSNKVDIWSLGCVVIEMASGKPPWSECAFENPFRALYHIGNSDATPRIPDSLSPEGRDFVTRCLQRDPNKRADAEELLQHKWLAQPQPGRRRR